MERRGEIAAFRAGRERDALDEGANSFGRFVALLRMPKRFCEPLDLAAVHAGDIRVHVRNVHRSVGEAGFQFILSHFKLAQPHNQGAAAAALLDESDDFLH
ncbi:MAG: hypothetical protein ACLP8A_17165 [Methylovirgula sp.]